MRALVLFLTLLPLAARAEGPPVEGPLFQRVAQVLGQKRLGRELSVANAAARFAPLVELKAQPEGPQGLELSGQGGEVRWALLTFYPGAKKGTYEFQFLQLGLAPADGDLARLEKALAEALGRKLGRPRRSDGSWVFRVGRWDLWLRAGPAANPLSPARAEEKVLYVELSPVNDD